MRHGQRQVVGEVVHILLARIYIIDTIHTMNAQCLFNKKKPFAGGMVEMVIWQLPTTTAERPHGLKYRLVYIVAGQRVIGYDNELGKGDHKHLGAVEMAYEFVSLDQLIADFLEDVRRVK